MNVEFRYGHQLLVKYQNSSAGCPLFNTILIVFDQLLES